MTAITMICDKNDHYIKGFQIHGHAGAGKVGEDVVCAAVSILAINTQNAIERLCQDAFSQSQDQKRGRMKFILKDRPGHDAALLLEAARIGFEEIAKEYEKFVSMNYKEV